MSGTIYNIIGDRYNTNRTADERTLKIIIDLLNLPAGKLIADIGAGTGNYTNALANSGYRLFAVEPSEIMRQQTAPNGNVAWIAGLAESLPLQEASMDGVVIVLALHHFSDIRSAAREVARVCPAGPLVVLTMDPRESEKFWFYDYFPEIAEHVLRSFPLLNKVVDIFLPLETGQLRLLSSPCLPTLPIRICARDGTDRRYTWTL